jgi:hypothetical protein
VNPETLALSVVEGQVHHTVTERTEFFVVAEQKRGAQPGKIPLAPPFTHRRDTEYAEKGFKNRKEKKTVVEAPWLLQIYLCGLCALCGSLFLLEVTHEHLPKLPG